ncbi:CHAT domain-containing protein [Streptomyces sp. S.PB5]|uniref:CHAT domain-containing tetratricopeptide repeat protein n=1 Tax=Streptomyces sp. S.PB5 TaxID=3020844 RepID=UPI0025B03F44|nr:CHAT domain-containing protein [Streptomyces sp. S.PB5]MDN3024997.1 CHAT domain-containing protein [Streptomyces sp. S.PB5]
MEQDAVSAMKWKKRKAPTTEETIAALRARLARFVRAGDTDAVLGDSALDEARVLLGDLPEGRAGAETLSLCGMLHFARFQVLPAGQDQQELFIAVQLFTLLDIVAPEMVPPELRPLIRLDSAGPKADRTAPQSGAEADAERALDVVRLAPNAPHSLDEAVHLLREALRELPRDHPNRGRYLAALDDALEQRFELKGAPEDLDEAIEVSREAVTVSPPSHPDHASALSNLGNALGMRFDLAQQPADLDEAITVGRKARTAARADHPARAQILSNLGANLRGRYERNGKAADLKQAVTLLRQAADLLPHGHPVRAAVVSNLGGALVSRYGRSNDPADLDEAIVLYREAIRPLPPGHPKVSGLQSNLSGALCLRFEHAHDRGELDEAIDLSRQAVASTPPGHSTRAAILDTLARALQTRFDHAGDREDLDAAVAARRELLAATPADHPDRRRYLMVLSELLRDRFERAQDRTDLDEAIESGRQATRADDAVALANLGTSLLTRYEHSHGLPDLDEAIKSYQQAAGADLKTVRARTHVSAMLCVALVDRYEHTGDTTALEEAVAEGRRAVAAARRHLAPDSATAVGALVNLGIALRRSYERHGRQDDLAEAVEVTRQAVAAVPADSPRSAQVLTNLGGIMFRFYELTGELGFLNESVDVQRRAAQANAPDPRAHTICLANLGIALHIRFEHSGNQTDLEEAITVDRQALDSTPGDHADRPRRLISLGNALAARGTIEDLDEAVELSRQAVAAMRGHHDRARYLVNLSNALRKRSEHDGAPGYLDSAIEQCREALDLTPPGHPTRATQLLALAEGLRQRAAHTPTTADLDETVALCQEAARVMEAPPIMRARAARLWGRAAADAGSWAVAAQGYKGVAELLAYVTPRGMNRLDQEHWLAELTLLGSDGAACFLQAGQPEQAVEFWEFGRGLLLSRALDTRIDLAALPPQKRHLATDFVRLCDQLDRASAGGAPGVSNWGEWAPPGRGADHRQQLREELEQVVGTIRALPGLQHFGLPTPADELLTAARRGPIVLLTVSAIRSDALLLTPEGIRVARLPQLTPDALVEQLVTFQNSVDLHHIAGLTERAEQGLHDVLRWLWDAVTEPVLDALGMTERGGSAPDGRWPRIWWCPAGPLSFLPLHAAGDHSTRFDPVPRTVLDRVVSSYTPTIRALTYARRSPAAAGPGGLLAVAVPSAPGVVPLPFVMAEADAVVREWPGQVDVLYGDVQQARAKQPDVPMDARADFATVIRELPRHRSAHFACHATSDMTTPSASCLVLADHRSHPLTVTDLARLHLADADLAYLSTCATARSGPPRLADEALHLSSAFQLAGYRHVIATLWPITDESALFAARMFYQRVARQAPHSLSDTTAADALHDTVRALRDSLGAQQPWKWAAHLHSGG